MSASIAAVSSPSLMAPAQSTPRTNDRSAAASLPTLPPSPVSRAASTPLQDALQRPVAAQVDELARASRALQTRAIALSRKCQSQSIETQNTMLERARELTRAAQTCDARGNYELALSVRALRADYLNASAVAARHIVSTAHTIAQLEAERQSASKQWRNIAAALT